MILTASTPAHCPPLDKHASLIEGSYEKGRTDKIAELYHKARIDRRPATKNDLRLGDLYLKPGAKGAEPTLWAVLTPDCDLVVRSGKMEAERILTVRGNLIAYDAPKSSLSEFIIIKDRYYSVDWRLKDLETRTTLSDMEFVGTLRPIYAQDLQRKALQDLGRIGLAVAPVIRMDAAIKLRVVKHGKLVDIDLGEAEMTRSEIYPSRGASDAPKVVLSRSATENLLAVLEQLDPDGLDAEAITSWKSAKGRAGANALRTKLLKGAGLEEQLGSKIVVTERMSVGKGWCGLEISMATD